MKKAVAQKIGVLALAFLLLASWPLGAFAADTGSGGTPPASVETGTGAEEDAAPPAEEPQPTDEDPSDTDEDVSSADADPSAVDEEPSPAEDIVIPQGSPSSAEIEDSTVPAGETKDDASVAPQGLATIEELLDAARVDGALAARLLSEYPDGDAYFAALDEVLELYYAPATAESYVPQLVDFAAAVDARAAETLARYAAAAAERADQTLGYVPGEVLVVFEDEVMQPQAEEVVEELDGEVLEMLPAEEEPVVAVAELPLDQTVEEAVAAFESDPAVAHVQPNFMYEMIGDVTNEEPAGSAAPDDQLVQPAGDGALTPDAFFTPNDTFMNDQRAYLDALHMREAYADLRVIQPSLSRIKVGVLDSPFDFSHEDFNRTPIDKKYKSYSYFTSGVDSTYYSQIKQPDYHGTHVAGIIGASANNGLGIAGVGNDPSNSSITLVPVNVFVQYKGDGGYYALTTTVVKAIRALVKDGVRVINLSLGGRCDYGQSDDLFDDALYYAYQKDCMVVCAAGNENTNDSYYPADSDYALGVIALDKNSNGTWKRAYYSNYGYGKDISAPGTVLSTLPGGYGYMTGTSMAAPIVSGVVALMLSCNKYLDCYDIQDVLSYTAKDLGEDGWDELTGDGMVDAWAAIAAVTNKVYRVSLNVTSKTLAVGGSCKITATVTEPESIYYDTRNETVSWSSNNTAVATVDKYGKVTAVAKGKATITAKSNANPKFYSTCTIYVGKSVTGVKKATTLTRLSAGKIYSFKATISPADAANQTLLWQCTDPDILYVHPTSGKVEGLYPGETTITVTTQDGKFKAKWDVEVYQLVTKIKLNSTAKTLTAKGKTYTLKATASPSYANNRGVTWKSSNTKVATVDQNGKVTAKATKGKCTITCTAKDASKKTATCVIAIGKPLTGFKLKTTSKTMKVNATYTIKPTFTPATAANKTVKWTSSNTKIATVSSKGVVKGLKIGDVTITGKAQEGGKKVTCKIKVRPAVTGVKLDTTSKVLTAKGKAFTLKASVQPSNAFSKAVTWKSSNTKVATVDANGKVTAKASKGKCTITCTTKYGQKTAKCTVYIGKVVTGVKLNKTAKTLAKGSSFMLTATTLPKDAANQTKSWTSSNKAVATVDKNGVVTAKAYGTATITVKTQNGAKTAKCVVTVPTSVTGVNLNYPVLTVATGDGPIQLAATVLPATATNKGVSWKSSNEAVATVNSTGLVAPLAPGAATITVTTKDGAKTAVCTVTVT